MTNDEIQLFTLIAFAVILVLALYKLYAIFNTPVSGPDTKTYHAQLEELIIDFLKHVEKRDLNAQELFELLIQQDEFNNEIHKNFNHNRLNQLLQQLFYTYEVNSLEELISQIHKLVPDIGKEDNA